MQYGATIYLSLKTVLTTCLVRRKKEGQSQMTRRLFKKRAYEKSEEIRETYFRMKANPLPEDTEEVILQSVADVFNVDFAIVRDIVYGKKK